MLALGAADRRAVLRPALRRRRPRSASPHSAGRADERPLRDAAARAPTATGWPLAESLQLVRRPVAHRLADAAAGRPRARRRSSTASCRRLRRARSEFSDDGNEVAFGTIGNASCAEGMFWEAVNAVGVLQAPVLLSIWDDGYGISVPNKLQITKGDLSAVLAGFRIASRRARAASTSTACAGWDYPALCETYRAPPRRRAREHVPAIVHVAEMTQPQGHSTSGSHERYKTPSGCVGGASTTACADARVDARTQAPASARSSTRSRQEERAVVREAQRRARGRPIRRRSAPSATRSRAPRASCASRVAAGRRAPS